MVVIGKRRRAQPRVDDAASCFLFDGDCGFCRKWAVWLEHRAVAVRFVPFQEFAGLAQLGLTVEDVQTASYLIEGGLPYRGGRGIARALTHGRGLWRLVGRVLDLPGIRLATAAVYRWIVRNRHRLPAPPTIPDPDAPESSRRPRAPEPDPSRRLRSRRRRSGDH